MKILTSFFPNSVKFSRPNCVSCYCSRLRTREIIYQRAMEQAYRATHKQIRGIGITDITTECTHFEIKRWKHWKSGLGQLIAYNVADPKKHMVLCLFGEDIQCDDRKDIVVNVLTKAGIRAMALEDECDSIRLIDLSTKEVVARFNKP